MQPKYCEEINPILHTQGIQHRTSGGIKTRIWVLEKSVALARNILGDNEVRGVIDLDACGEDLKTKVLRCCPHFEFLAPVMLTSIKTALPAKDQRLVDGSGDSAQAMDMSPDNVNEENRCGLNGDDDAGEPLNESQPKCMDAAVIPEENLVLTTTAKETRQSIAWDKDRVHEKNSLEILLEWLSNPDNYARWKSTRSSTTVTKKQLCHEIKLLLQTQGIVHRKTGDIRTRTWSLERSLTKAKALLQKRGLKGLTSLDGCDLTIKCDALQCCEHFQTLAPAMTTPTSRQRNIICEAESKEDEAMVTSDQLMSSVAHTEEENSPETEVTEPSEERNLQVDGANIEAIEIKEEGDTCLNKAANEVIEIKSEEDATVKTEQVAPMETHIVIPSPHAHQKSSLHILLQWLSTEGKYKRWRNGHKESLCDEIVGLFHLEGVFGYTSADVLEMISGLEHSAENANELLVKNGKWDILSLDECEDERLKSKILLCCPYFNSLAPIIMTEKRSAKKIKCEGSDGNSVDLNSIPVILVDNSGQSEDEDVVEIVVVKEEFNAQPCRITKKRQFVATSNTIPNTESPEQHLKPSEVLDIELWRARFQVDQEKRQIELDATREKSKIDVAASIGKTEAFQRKPCESRS